MIKPDYSVENIDLDLSDITLTNISKPKDSYINFNMNSGIGFNHNKYILADKLEMNTYSEFLKRYKKEINADDIDVELYIKKWYELAKLSILREDFKNDNIYNTLLLVFDSVLENIMNSKDGSELLLLFIYRIPIYISNRRDDNISSNKLYNKLYHITRLDVNNVKTKMDLFRLYLDDTGVFNSEYNNYSTLFKIKRNIFIDINDYNIARKYVIKYNTKIVNSPYTFKNIINDTFDNYPIGNTNVSMVNLFNKKALEYFNSYLLYVIYKSIYEFRYSDDCIQLVYEEPNNP